MTLRTFIAIPMPEDIADHLSRLHGSVPGEAGRITWVKREAIHLTCSFLGEVEETRVTGIRKALEMAAATLAPFEMSLDGIGAFPGFRRPRVVWVGLEKGEAEIVQFKQELEQRLEPLGFGSNGRRYDPHITLGRVREPGDPSVLEHAASRWVLPFEHWMCREVVLFRSELTRHGAVHTPLVRAHFGGGTGAA